MKTLLIFLDGLPDKTSSKYPKTPLEIARHPHLDSLVKCGMLGNVDFAEKIPDTDVCTLKMLGYTDNPGRGFIDSLGAGVPVHKDWIYLRCNFATVNEDGRIIDRRAGRDPTGLDKIADRLNGIQIQDVTFHVYRSEGDDHRIAIALEGKGLSDAIKPNDSKGKDDIYKQVGFKIDSAKKTSSVLNAFLKKAREIMEKHPVNSTRNLPANAILVRNSGKSKDVKSFEKKYGFKGKVIAFILTVKGVAKWLGMDSETPKGATGSYDTDISAKLDAALNALKRYDFVMLHIDGADIASHDGKFNEKVKFIERLDKELFSKIEKEFDLKQNLLVITSDHITETGNYHIAGPVPFLVVGKSVKPNNLATYTEEESKKGKKLKETLLDKIL